MFTSLPVWDLSQKPGQMKTGLCEGVKWGDVSRTLGVPQALGWLTGCKSPGGVVVRLSIAVLKHQDPKQLGKEISSYMPYSVTERENSGQEPEAGTEAGATQGCCLPACSPRLPRLAYWAAPDTYLGVALPTMGQPLPYEILIKKMPHRLSPKGQSHGDIFLFPDMYRFVLS